MPMMTRIVLSLMSDVRNGDKKMMMCLLFDSGSDTHVTNDNTVFDNGTVRSCCVSVYGISDDDSVHMF